MTKIKEYFLNLNTSAFPEKARDYIRTQILVDDDLSLLDETDEDFVDVKALIESNYPQSTVKIIDEKPEVGGSLPDAIGEPATTGGSKEKIQQAIEDFEFLLEMADTDAEKQKIQTAIEDLQFLLDMDL